MSKAFNREIVNTNLSPADKGCFPKSVQNMLAHVNFCWEATIEITVWISKSPEFPDSHRWAITIPRIGMKTRRIIHQHLCYLLQTFECKDKARQATNSQHKFVTSDKKVYRQKRWKYDCERQLLSGSCWKIFRIECSKIY